MAIDVEPSTKPGGASSKEESGVRCEYIQMRDTERKTNEKFKLFREKDIPFLSHCTLQVTLNEMACDNDCLTENDQVDTSIRFLQKELTESVGSYLKQKHKLPVHNLSKFGHDRAMIQKKHRIY